MAKKASTTKKREEFESESYFDRVGTQVESNQSKLTMVLGGLIILVVVILLFNYFNRTKPSIGPSQQTQQAEGEDVSPEKLPGKYTIKEGDTLFSIAEKYYNDGYKYTEIVQANNLENPDSIEVGQDLEIPKLSDQLAVSEESPEPSETPADTPEETPVVEKTEQPSPTPVEEIIATPEPQEVQPLDSTTSVVAEWGPAITGDTYTVAEGDWLSTIAARAYNGDVLAYSKLAQANNIQNPDLIYPGQVLTLPR